MGVDLTQGVALGWIILAFQARALGFSLHTPPLIALMLRCSDFNFTLGHKTTILFGFCFRLVRAKANQYCLRNQASRKAGTRGIHL